LLAAHAFGVMSEASVGELTELIGEPRPATTLRHAIAVPPGTVPRASRPGEPVRIVSVGRLVTQKGFAVLLDALATLDDAPEFVLDVIGAGPEARALRHQARSLG